MRMRALLLLLLVGASSAAYAESPFGAAAVADEDLAAMRGGFSLPNGVEISLAVQSQTMVDGAVVLRSIFTAGVGAPQLAVYVPDGSGSATAPAAARQSASAASAAEPRISYDSQQGLVVMPGNGAVPLRVAIGGQQAAAAIEDNSGLTRVAVPAGGSVDTAAGTVRVVPSDVGGRVELSTADFATAHLFGQAFGFVTANTGSDRAIDTTTTVNVALANVSPDTLGSSLLRSEALALDSTRMLSR